MIHDQESLDNYVDEGYDVDFSNQEEFDVEFDAPTTNPRLQKQEAALLVAGDSYTSFREESSFDLFNQFIDQLQTSKAEDLAMANGAKVLREDIQGAAEFGLESPEGAVAYVQERQQELAAPDTLQRQAVEAMSLEDNEFNKAVIADAYVGQKLQELLDNTSTGEKILNVLGEFTPVSVWDRTDMLGVDLFSYDSDMKQLVVNYASMSPEEQIKNFPAIQAMVVEATDGNELRAVRFLSEIAGLSDLGHISDLFWDTLDFATLISPAAILKATKANKIVNVAAKVNKPKAGELVAAAAASDEAADALQMTKTDVAITLSPFEYGDNALDAVDGIQYETIASIQKAKRDVAEAVRALEDDLIQRPALTDKEMVIAQDKALRQFDEEVAVKLKEEMGWVARDAQITSTSPTGFTVEYKMNDATGKELRTKPVTVNYTKNDVGEWEAIKSGGIETRVASPSVWANKIQKDVVETATSIEFSQAQIIQRMFKVTKNTLKGLNKDSIKKVDDILLMGDSYTVDGIRVGKVYTPKELMLDGVPGYGVLTREEASAYYGMREMFDQLHRLKDHQVSREKAFRGEKLIGKTDEGNVFGSPINRSEVNTNIKTMVDMETGNTITMSKVDEMLETGNYKLFAIDGAIDKGEDLLEYAIVNTKTVKEIPATGVLPKINAYVPLIRDKAYYIVREEYPRIINGSKGVVPRTIRMFDNKIQAEEFALKEQARTGRKTTAAADRDIDLETRSSLENAQFGGVITGHRTVDREILFGYDGTTPTRLNTLESLERNIAHISNTMPMNEFRMGIEERWRRSAGKYLNDPANPNSGYRAGMTSKEVVGLDSMRKWIDDQLRIPTESEQKWAGSMRGFAEWMEGSKFFLDGKGKRARLAMQDLSHSDPFAAARAVAFHSLLGWYNPAQLLVQAAGASLAVSLDPIKFPKIMKQYSMMRASIFTENTETIRNVAKAMGDDPDKWEHLVKAFKRTGMHEALKTNADYNAARLGYGIDGSAVARAWTGAKEGGLVFFREGELFTRGYTWLLAADNYMEANKLTRLADKDIDAITGMALKKSLNLNRSNRANWQKGWMSIPTQFWQINAKFLEAMLPSILPGSSRKYTGMEKAKVFMGQLALFGAAGVPLGDAMVRGWLEYSGAQVGDYSDEQLEFMQQGIAGVTMRAMTGESIDIAERLGTAGGLNILVRDIVGGNKEITDFMLGAAGAFPNRVMQAIGAVTPRFSELELSKDEAIVIASEFGQIVSTFRNAHKAYIYGKLGSFRTSDGTTIDYADWSEDFKVLVAQGMGFSPSLIKDYYGIAETERAREQGMKDVLKGLEMAYRQFALGDVTDDKWIERHRRLESLLLETLAPMEQEKVKRRWADKLTGTPELWEAYQRAYNAYMESDYELNPSKIQRGLPLNILSEEQ